jgi:hypothetical protein
LNHAFIKEDLIVKSAEAVITGKAGEPCPQGGVWHPVGSPNDKRTIGADNIMPATPHKEAHWVLHTPNPK